MFRAGLPVGKFAGRHALSVAPVVLEDEDRSVHDIANVGWRRIVEIETMIAVPMERSDVVRMNSVLKLRLIVREPTCHDPSLGVPSCARA
jgi:hypothetical protein